MWRYVCLCGDVSKLMWRYIYVYVEICLVYVEICLCLCGDVSMWRYVYVYVNIFLVDVCPCLCGDAYVYMEICLCLCGDMSRAMLRCLCLCGEMFMWRYVYFYTEICLCLYPSGMPGQLHNAEGVPTTWDGSSQLRRRSWHHRSSGGCVGPLSYPALEKMPVTRKRRVVGGRWRRMRKKNWF